jgi:hypothetical protein
MLRLGIKSKFQPRNLAMTASKIRWSFLALLYVVFHFWYGGNGTPLTPNEVTRFIELAETLGPEAAGKFKQFALSDDGREFVMVNLNQYRDQPIYKDGRSTDETSEEVETKYTSQMLRRLLARASHPLISVEPIQNFPGEGEVKRTLWDRVTMVRYRSRRDFLEIVLMYNFHEDVQHKWAALLNTHSLPSTPRISWVGVRLIPFLALLCLGLILDRWLGRKNVHHHAET